MIAFWLCNSVDSKQMDLFLFPFRKIGLFFTQCNNQDKIILMGLLYLNLPLIYLSRFCLLYLTLTFYFILPTKFKFNTFFIFSINQSG